MREGFLVIDHYEMSCEAHVVKLGVHGSDRVLDNPGGSKLLACPIAVT